tara:strand:- start:117 stop:293 length:177 start_codon:yes stop_codon:yes gene_type:complete
LAPTFNYCTQRKKQTRKEKKRKKQRVLKKKRKKQRVLKKKVRCKEVNVFIFKLRSKKI